MEDKKDERKTGKKTKRRRRRLYEATPEAFPAESVPGTEPPSNETRHGEAKKIVAKYTYISMGTALIPFPILDMAAVAAVELQMLKKLCLNYDMEFSNENGKSFIAALTGGYHAGLLTGSLLKSVPMIGLAGALVSTGVMAGAITYAVGVLFIKHFESGGTFLDFRPRKKKEEFQNEYRDGLKVASKLKKERK